MTKINLPVDLVQPQRPLKSFKFNLSTDKDVIRGATIFPKNIP